MTLSRVGICTDGGNGVITNNNNCILTLPAGCAPGDILVTVDTECSGGNTLTTTGNTVLRGPVYGGSIIAHYVQWRSLSSGDISAVNLPRQWSGAGRPSASGIVYRGVDTTKIAIDAAVSNTISSTASQAAPSLTTTVNLSAVLILLSGRVGTPPGTVSSIASLYTKEQEAIVNQAASANSTSAIHRLTTPGAAGSFGGNTVNFSPNSAGTIISTVSLAPLPDATGYRHMWNGSAWIPMTTLIGT